MVGYSNMLTEKRKYEAERRRVRGEMAKVNAAYIKANKHRAEMEAAATEMRPQVDELIRQQEDAKKHNDYFKVMELHQAIEYLAGQITTAKDEAEKAQEAADKAKANYADWQQHMPAPWRLVPILCPVCMEDEVDAGLSGAGICGDCDADVPLPPGTIRHEGRSYAPWWNPL